MVGHFVLSRQPEVLASFRSRNSMHEYSEQIRNPARADVLRRLNITV
jgi:hypothetical protein